MEVAIERAVDAEQVRIWAGLQGFVSLAALIALALFFLLATPFSTPQSRWSWLGPVNDWLAVIGAVPWIVAMVLLARYVAAGPWMWALTVAACVGAAAIAIVTLFMLAGVAGLQLQAIVSLGATVVAFAWAAFAGSLAQDAGLVPGWIATLAVAMVVALVVGGILGVVGYATGAGSSVQATLYVVAGVVGGLAWLAFPVWWIGVASTLR
ncbi:hypothetical protein [Agromyces bracchium]|uniref:Uncharacterized protein n=1 Tax=Agromyces bracchium TaxID=88376 RepID=A0A6I3M8F1_9MICO|nr:hypothetical protein [Agromyces bracchium]MTH67636.1 hypothetical protein [Agromyces bracchium]